MLGLQPVKRTKPFFQPHIYNVVAVEQMPEMEIASGRAVHAVGPFMAIRLCGEDVRSQPASIVRPLCGSQHAEEIFVESDVGSTDDPV